MIGATGATAGGLARAILDDPTGGFTCRAITRDPDSPAARTLADLGATIIRADLDDIDSLVHAFDGAYGAFCMTTFWQHFSAEHETKQGANQARAAATAGVRHAIWSTLEDSRRWYPLDDTRMPTITGRYKVPPFDAKAEADQSFKDAGVPTTYLLTPTHWDAFVYGKGVPQPGPDGVLTLPFPIDRTVLPGIAAVDIGRCAYQIFRAPERYIDAKVGLASEHTSGQRLAEALTRIMEEPVRYQPIPLQVFRSLPIPGVELAANMFQFIGEVPEYAAQRDVSETRSLLPSLLSLDAWADQTRMKRTSEVA